MALLNLLSNNKKLNGEIRFDKETFEFDEINNLEIYQKNDDVNEKKHLSEIDEAGEISVNEIYHRSFKQAYQRMDHLLARGKDETSKVRWSGASTCNCFIEKRNDEGWIHLSNCGKKINNFDNYI